MENYFDETQLLFEIEGQAKRRFLKKLRTYAAGYTRGICCESDGNYYEFTRKEIVDIYIKEPVVEDVKSRTTVIDYIDAGVLNSFEMDDNTFPGLSEMIELTLANEWSYLTEQYAYPETVKWFVACCSVVSIVSGLNPCVFGNNYNDKQFILDQREELQSSWGFNDEHDFLSMLPDLLDGRAVKKYKASKNGDDCFTSMKTSDEEEYERCLWAWDLQRLILLCKLGIVCDYISWGKALDWCLLAGNKLQQLFCSWDDFMNSYLTGYCAWSGDDIEDEDSQAYERKQVYEYYKTLPQNPWQVAWNHPLKCEW